MNENDQTPPDPSATFRLDQEAAEAEAQTRDQMGWDLHVQDAQAQVAMKVAAAANEQAKADLRGTISTALAMGATGAAVWAITQAVQAVAGWVQ